MKAFFCSNLKNEIENIISELCKLSKYALIKQCVSTKTNVKGSFLSTIINVEERKIVDSAMKYFKMQGFVIGSYMFDGFMIEKNKLFKTFSWDALSAFVKDETSFKVHFAEKSLVPTVRDYVHLRPIVNNPYLDNVVSSSVFKSIKSKEEELNKTPHKDNILVFYNYAMQELNKVFCLVRGKIATVVEAKGFDRDGLLNYERRRLKDTLECYFDKNYVIKYVQDGVRKEKRV